MLRDCGYKPAPDFDAYSRASDIPEAERCTNCDGVGTERTRYSSTGEDWKTCRTCHGSGRKQNE